MKTNTQYIVDKKNLLRKMDHLTRPPRLENKKSHKIISTKK